ncbi:hypothetical protein GCM10029963_16160 [Micromonospora andamanensis]|uniref:hypothetical protein n=1 Tax=Micromonospora andamanensis TaxID=1287068 RepID=UPI00195255C9|nr:hypothetical protein [Micromonospora andamanensis]GIJ39671.1 hypothetical protein Vwe01_29960 [Micromonospora andamanensis]
MAELRTAVASTIPVFPTTDTAASEPPTGAGRTARWRSLTRHRLTRALAHRWPAGLALLVTADNWASPTLLGAYTLLVLPVGYLVIGTLRRQWGVPGNLRLQLAGLAGWSALALLAMLAGGTTGAWLVAFGWLAHAGWDLLHLRSRQVVPRAYAECCVVIDAVLGITIMLALLAG